MHQAQSLSLGEESEQRRIAILQRQGQSPGLFFLGGFMSDMCGTKAKAVDQLGAQEEVAVTRFDYSGHGQSGSDIAQGTISRWLDEAQAVFESTKGPQILVGSSMGGWLALLLNNRLKAQGEGRVHAIVLIAPATDMTETMRKTFSPEQLHELHNKGRIEKISKYSDQPYIITEQLITDGARHALLSKGSIITGCPVTILQGGLDEDVPPAHALQLLSHLTSDPVTFTLIPDGDHRLSRDQDIALLEQVLRDAIHDARAQAGKDSAEEDLAEEDLAGQDAPKNA